MRTLLDTSVVVPAVLQRHQFYSRALPWLIKAETDEIDGIISSHTLAEVYKVLTGLNSRPRFTSSQVMEIIHSKLLSNFEIVALDADDMAVVLKQLADMNIRGGTIYDGLIAYAAFKSNADQIVTFNERDFTRVSAGLPLQIIVP